VKIKVCGLCRPEDAAAAARAGADYAGVILAPGFQRTQIAQSAAAIYDAAGPLLRAGVFVNQEAGDIVRVADELRLDVVQLHGDEGVDLVAGIRATTRCEIWKTVWLRSHDDLNRAIDLYGPAAHGLLLDAKRGGRVGGTGSRFDWSLAAAARHNAPDGLQVIVAGGLTPANVRAAIVALAPDVVDVASGVEESVGRKSETAIAAFVRNARI